MTDKERLAAISEICERAAKQVKEYVKEGFSTDLRERLSLWDVKEIRRLAKQPKGTK